MSGKVFGRFFRRRSRHSMEPAEAAHRPESATVPGPSTYEVLYEAVAGTLSDEEAVGGGSFEHVGRLELSVLASEGLAREDLETRWGRVRCVTTSVDLMTAISRLAGWSVLRWYPGDQANIPMGDTGQLFPFAQSVCVLEAP